MTKPGQKNQELIDWLSAQFALKDYHEKTFQQVKFLLKLFI